MIKLKKLLTGVLGAAMMLTSMTALASSDSPVTTAATIDTSLKGSLTIHKYEYNGTSEGTATGKNTDIVPTGSNPLAGAGFTIYKVVDTAAMINYYSTNPTALPDVSEYADMTEKVIKDQYASSQVGNEVITGKYGIAKFENLDLGFYVVVETTKPDSVTTAMQPFIVSVPMTTVDGEEWLYDVHVYPKNSTGYGKVELKKTAADGTTAIKDVSFELYKKNADGTKYTKITKEAGAGGDNTGNDLTLKTNANGIITVENLTKGNYYFVETSIDNNAGYIIDTVTKYEFTVNEDNTVTYGETTDANVTINVKNEKPDFDKEVKDAVGNWGHDADYSVGDTVPYRLIIDVPTNVTKLKTFTAYDVPTNLKDEVSSIVLKYGETADAAINAVAAAAYDAEAEGDGFKITFTPSEMTNYAGKIIVVEYNAKLLDTAVTTNVGNPNTATLEYSSKIVPSGDSSDDKDKIVDEAVVYTFKINVEKRANNSSGAPLSGVEFNLYKYDGNESITKEEQLTGLVTDGIAKKIAVKTGTNGYVADSTLTASDENTVLTTDAQGKISVSGLENGTYYLVETKTKDDYNLLKEPIKVTLSVGYTWSWSESTEWVNGTLTKHDVSEREFTFTEGTTDDTTENDGYESELVINKRGFTLPTTGGMGSIIFIVGGIAIALAGLLIILASRKKTAAE